MDIKAFLAEQGLGEEDITAIVGNDKAAKAVSAALSRYDEGTSALTTAQREREEVADMWEKTITPALTTKQAEMDRVVAEAQAEKAASRAKWKAYADAGWDVPKAYYEGGTTATATAAAQPRDPATGNYMTREDFSQIAKGTSTDLIKVIQLAGQYQDLYGAPYLNGDKDFSEAQQARKPLTQYVAEKYKFDDKLKEREQAKTEAMIAKRVEDGMKAKEEEWAARNGGNVNLRAPMPSKNDRLAQIGAAPVKDAWKNPQSREASRLERTKKFENVVIQ